MTSDAAETDVRSGVGSVVEQARRQRGDLEHQILAVLSVADGPMTAAEVRGTLDPGLAYNTVLTVITRPRPRHARPALAATVLSLSLLAATGVASLHVQQHGERLFETVMNGPTHPVAHHPAPHRPLSAAAPAEKPLR